MLTLVSGCVSAPPGGSQRVAAAGGAVLTGTATSAQLEAIVADTLAPAGRVYRVSDVVRRAVSLPGQGPLRGAAGADGCAELQFIVGPRGRLEPGMLAVAEGSDAALAERARLAVADWRYRPAERPAGTAVRQLVRLVVLKRGSQVIFSHDSDLLPGRCPRPEV